jgi:hypothetical protein
MMNEVTVPLSLAVWDPEVRLPPILDMMLCPKGVGPGYALVVAWTGTVEVNQGFFEGK